MGSREWIENQKLWSICKSEEKLTWGPARRLGIAEKLANAVND